MTVQRVKQVQGLCFCDDIAPSSCCSLLMVWTGGCIFMVVWVQDAQTLGEARTLISCPAISKREKCVSSSKSRRWPSRVPGQQIHSLFSDSLGWAERDSKTSGGARNARCEVPQSPGTKRRRGQLLPAAAAVPGAAGCAPPGWRVRAWEAVGCAPAGRRVRGRRRLQRSPRCSGAGEGGGGSSGGPGPPVEVWKKRGCVCRSCRLPALVPSGTCDTRLLARRFSVYLLILFISEPSPRPPVKIRTRLMKSNSLVSFFPHTQYVLCASPVQPW